MSMFTSCKDYDDDINKNADAIAALQAQVSSLESALNAAKAEAATAHATFATKTELGDVDAAVKALAEEVKSLVTVDQLNSAIADAKATLQAAIDGKADKADLTALATKVDGIDSKLNTLGTSLNTLETAVKAAEANITAQQTAINELKTKLTELEATLATKASQADLDKLAARVKALEDLTADLETVKANVKTNTSDIATLKTQMKDLDAKVNKALNQVNLLTVFISKRLTSIVFWPDAYWDGIEAVECVSLDGVPARALLLDDKGKDNAGTDKEFFGYLQRNGKVSRYSYYDDQLSRATRATAELVGDSLVYKYPNAYAYYLTNPSSADIVGQKVDFFCNLVDTRGWADDMVNILAYPDMKDDSTYSNVISKDNVADGLLVVPFLPNWLALKMAEIKGYSQVNPVWDLSYGYNELMWEMATYFGENPFEYMEWNGLLEEEYKADWAATVALRVQANDTTVVSDFARLEPSFIHQLLIADNAFDSGYNDGTEGEYDLWTNVLDRIDDNDYVHYVAYDSSIDLSKYVETHFSRELKGEEQGDGYYEDHIVMSKNMMDNLGLHYEYTIINYVDGSNGTQQSKHIQMNGTVFTPRNVTEAGETILDKPADRSAVGRKPVIRVALVDKEGRTLAIGYEKIVIVDKDVPAEEQSFEFTQMAYVNCDNANIILTWAQIENKILSLLNITNDEFQNYYKIDRDQYVYYNGKYMTTKDYRALLAEMVYAGQITEEQYDELAKYHYGDATFTKDSEEYPGTMVLVWNLLDRQYDYEGLLEAAGASDESKGLSTKEISTIIRIYDANGTSGKSVFVKLVVPAGKIQFAYGQLTNKKEGLWYKLYGTGEANKEVRLNVPVDVNEGVGPLTGQEFQKPLVELFNDNTPKWGDLDTKKNFKNFAQNIEHYFQFTLPDVKKGNVTDKTVVEQLDLDEDGKADLTVWQVKGVSGRTYRLRLNGEKNTIYVYSYIEPGKTFAKDEKFPGTSDNTTVVSIFENDDDLQVIKYYYGNLAHDILNYQAHGKLAEGETFTAYLEYVGASCYNLLMDNSKYFNVRFQRPVNLSPKNPSALTDAPQNGDWVNLAAIPVSTDWRNYTCETSAGKGKGKGLIEYYVITYLWGDDEDGTNLVKQIRTDIGLSDSERDAFGKAENQTVEKIDKLSLASPAGDNDRSNGFKLEVLQHNFGTADKPNNALALHYTNAENNVKKFHLFVPIKMYYKYCDNFAPAWWAYQREYATITVNLTENNPGSARQDK